MSTSSKSLQAYLPPTILVEEGALSLSKGNDSILFLWMLLAHRSSQLKQLCKGRDYSHLTDEEVEVSERLRHSPKHATKVTGRQGAPVPFCQGWCQFIALTYGWLVPSFHPPASHFGRYMLWWLPLLASGRDRIGMLICVTDSKPRTSYYPRLPV